MQHSIIIWDEHPLASVLSACACLPNLQHDRQFHAFVIKGGFQSDAFVESAHVEMYAKCICVEDARHIFEKMREDAWTRCSIMDKHDCWVCLLWKYEMPKWNANRIRTKWARWRGYEIMVSYVKDWYWDRQRSHI